MSIDTTKLEAIALAAAEGRRADSEARERAIERLNELRESLRKRIGTVNLVVPTLRSIRDE